MPAWGMFVILGGLLVAMIVVFFISLEKGREGIGMTAGVISILLAIGLLIAGWMAVMPQYRLWRASIEKRIAVEEALAEADAAVELKRAEVTRAEGVAEANIIITESIDEQYIRWLYVNNLADHNASEIIYIPTEGGLPILEANRLTPNE